MPQRPGAASNVLESVTVHEAILDPNSVVPAARRGE
jgi:hypothetical protein